MDVRLRFADQVMLRFGTKMTELGDGKAKLAMKRAIVHTGKKAKTQVVRALTSQTGLKRKTIVRAVKDVRAGDLQFILQTDGGEVSLRHFKARETRAGVKASPWNKPQVFKGTFMKGGRFPKRVGLKMNGQVFQRTGSKRSPIERVKSGLFIPTEMVTGQTQQAWRAVIDRDLMPRLQHEIGRMLP